MDRCTKVEAVYTANLSAETGQPEDRPYVVAFQRVSCTPPLARPVQTDKRLLVFPPLVLRLSFG
jgi:hypothetical protein